MTVIYNNHFYLDCIAILPIPCIYNKGPIPNLVIVPEFIIRIIPKT